MSVLSVETKKARELATLTQAESSYIILMHDGNGLKQITLDAALSGFIANTAGAHNAIYRGKNLGDHVTEEQWAEIQAGTFKDMYVGDYWVINGVTWRIAGFDYWLGTGDTACTDHHVVIVPDSGIAHSVKMNSTNITTGAYVGSDYYTGANGNTGRATARAAINNAFGSAHILNHREYLKNAVTDGYETNGAYYDSTFELMTEEMVYGAKIFHNAVNGTNFAASYEIGNSQLPLFRLDHSKICIRAYWWLRGVAAPTLFCVVYWDGNADASNASYELGVRPAFGIYKQKS